MSEINQKDKTSEPAKGGSDLAPPEEILSDQELDSLIAETDPQFLKEMKTMAADKSLSMAEIHFSSTMEALNQEKDRWLKGSKISQKIVQFFPFVIYFSLVFRRMTDALKAFVISLSIRVKNFAYLTTHSVKTFFKEILLKKVKNSFLALKKLIQTFQAFSLKVKLGLLGASILLVGSVGFLYRISQHGVIPKKFDLFAPSLEKYASEVYFYDPEVDSEPFYENLRIAVHTVLLPKFYINLKPSRKSGPNPMGAFEFFVEGMSPEVVIEAKDREVEVRDRVSRVIEEFTFELIEDPEGKRRLCDKIKAELNKILTTGKIKEVYIKNVVIKP
jgi:hypothetical protein